MNDSASRGPDTAAVDLHRRPRLTAGVIIRNYGIILVFIALFVALSISSDSFLTVGNLRNLVDQIVTIGLIACAGTLVMIGGGFDLSVGAIYALSGVILAQVMPGVGVIPAILIALIAGATLGTVNGIITTRVNPLITTLATGIIFGGAALLVSGGFYQHIDVPGFDRVGNAQFIGIYYSSWAFAIFAIVLAVVLSRTVFGRYVYAVGGNPEAARLSGIRVNTVRTVTYALSGFAAALASVFYASRVGLADPAAGGSYALAAIAAIVVGGTSIKGGEGRVVFTVVGVLLLGMITNGFVLLGFDPLYQQIVQGAIILAAVAFDEIARRRHAA